MLKKILWGIGTVVLIGIIVGVVLYVRRDKPTTKETPVPEAAITPWEVLRARIDGNPFFRCAEGECQGFVVRGKDDAAKLKVVGVLGHDGSLAITATTGSEESSSSTVYTDGNGDGTPDKISGSNFPRPASISKMPEALKKEVIKKYEALTEYLVRTADASLREAFYKNAPE